MLHVDSALRDLTEWLCRRFQVLTGRTNVWLAFQLTNFSIVVFTVMLYLLACDPLPPCPGTVREWLRSLVPVRRVPAAVPED